MQKTSTEDLEKATLSWIATFQDLAHTPKNFESLSDGVVLTEIMHKIEPKIFDLSKINPEISDNWALRLTNIEYLFDGLENYYTNVLGTAFDRTYIDTFKISNNQNKEDLCNLVGLVIVAAVQSGNKESYINAILGLDDTFQTALMDLIERVLQRCNTEQPSMEIDTCNVLDNNMSMRASTTMYSVTHMTKLEMQEKRLLAKLEELENENHNLQAKLAEIGHDRDFLKTRNNELIDECNKKSQEVQKLLTEREEIHEKLIAQESVDEFKNQIKLRDHKVEQLEIFIEELKQKREYDTTKFEKEMEEQKKKMERFIKVEETMGTYKQAYDDYGNLIKKTAEMEEEMQKHKSKVEELNKINEGLQSKITTFKDKLEAAQTKNISQDIEMIKRETEIEGLKSEKKRLEASNNSLQKKIKEQAKVIEEKTKEQEEAAAKSENMLEKSEIEMVLEEAERKERSMIEDKQSLHETYISIIAEGEKEILQQENEILKAKCKEIQTENEMLKMRSKEEETGNDLLRNKVKEDAALIEKLKEENSKLKEENEKLGKVSVTPQPTVVVNQNQEALEAEIESLKKRLLEVEEARKRKYNDDQLLKLQNELEEKNNTVNQLAQQIEDLKASNEENVRELSYKIQDLEEEIDNRDGEIDQLSGDLQSAKGILAEIGNQKEEELKILATAMQELAFRNMELQRKLSLKTDSMPPLSEANYNTQNYKPMK